MSTNLPVLVLLLVNLRYSVGHSSNGHILASSESLDAVISTHDFVVVLSTSKMQGAVETWQDKNLVDSLNLILGATALNDSLQVRKLGRSPSSQVAALHYHCSLTFMLDGVYGCRLSSC